MSTNLAGLEKSPKAALKNLEKAVAGLELGPGMPLFPNNVADSTNPFLEASMRIKWRYETQESYEEAVKVLKKQCGSQWSRNDLI